MTVLFINLFPHVETGFIIFIRHFACFNRIVSERGGPALDRNAIEVIYQRQVSAVYRVCFTYMKNRADTEDAVADTFVRLLRTSPVFQNQEHEKAWLLRAAGQVCKDSLKHWWRRRESLEAHENDSIADDTGTFDHTLEAVCGLPDKYKTAVYLYYYEGYNAAEIADMLHKPASTVRNYLHEARGLLQKQLGGDFE